MIKNVITPTNIMFGMNGNTTVHAGLSLRNSYQRNIINFKIEEYEED